MDLPVADIGRRVFVDYGAADSSAQTVTFGLAIGVAPRPDPKGTSEVPYLFPFGTVLTPTTVHNFALRFANTGNCRHSAPTQGDGVGDDTPGARIAAFQIIDGARANCGDDLILNAIQFPEQNTQALTLRVIYDDLAGNRSNVYEYSIPPCDTDPSNQLVCWRP